MKASIKNLIGENPSGLLQIKSPLTIEDYAHSYGFGLENTCVIYEAKISHHSGKDWFKFGEKPLKELFTVKEESEGDLLVVFMVETIKEGRVYCHLILTDKAYEEILNDKKQYVLKIHQMYTQWLGKNHIAMNMTTS